MGSGPWLRRTARLTSTWTSTSTSTSPSPPTAILDEDATIAMTSRCNVDGGVDVSVAVKLNALGTTSRYVEVNLNVFWRRFQALFYTPSFSRRRRCDCA